MKNLRTISFFFITLIVLFPLIGLSFSKKSDNTTCVILVNDENICAKQNDLMESDGLLENFEKRIIDVYLPMIILARLLDTTVTSAPDIISLIKKRYRIQLSPGTVYPVFYNLEKNECIKVYSNRERKNYVLTSKGRDAILTFKLSKQQEPKIFC
jgi:hypothetical protein